MVASKTSTGDELLEHLLAGTSTDGVICSSPSCPSRMAAARHRARRASAWWRCCRSFARADLLAAGMIGDPDPFTATVNALELFTVDNVVISTLPGERSGWLRANLIERVQHATSVPVNHVVVDLEAGAAAPAA